MALEAAPVISRSSAKGKYRVVANSIIEAAWLRQLLQELHSPLKQSTLVYCDNINAMYLSTNLSCFLLNFVLPVL